MFFAGGLCFLLLGYIHRMRPQLPLWAKAIMGAKSLKTFAYVRLIVAMVLLLAIVLSVVLGVIPFNSFWIAFGINCIFIVLFDILVSRFFDDNSEQDKA